jgi:oligopeptide transport system substrate-binding protein
MRHLLTLFLSLFIACSGNLQHKEKRLNVSFNTFPQTLDPRKSGDFTSATLICLLYEGLTRCLPNGEVEYGIAEKIEVSEDQRVYTFHLRKSFWNDGRSVTAHDFESSWKKILDPAFPSLCSYLLFPVRNAEAYAKGELPLSEVGIRALDPRTLRVELERPTPYFLSLTAFPLLFPVPSHIEGQCQDWTPTFTASFVGNGPYRIEKAVSNGEILLVKNRQFWNLKKPSLDSIHISIVDDESTALQMFERKELDFVGGPLSPLSPDAIEQLKARGKLQFLPMAASTYISFNTTQFPFHNEALRKAFFLSIDREMIVKEVVLGEQEPASRLLPPALFGKRKKVLLAPFEPKAAVQLFQQALQELGIEPKSLESIVLYYKNGQLEKRLAQVLQSQWKKTLGIELKIESAEAKNYQQRLHSKDYQISIASWIAQFSDPINLLERFRLGTNPKNYAGWESAPFGELLAEAASAANPEMRIDLLEKAEALFGEEMPIAPLYHWTCPYTCHSRLKTIATTPVGGVLFDKFEVD